MKNIKHFEEWVSVTDCHICKKQIKTNESYRIPVEKKFFGVKGHMNVEVCKECYREEQLEKLFKSENTE